MKIKLRDNPKHPFFFTVDKVIGVTRSVPEQILDESKLTAFHRKVLEAGVKEQVIDIISDAATPSADPESGAIPYSNNSLRKAIYDGRLTIEDAEKLLAQEKTSKNPRKSIIKELDYFIKREPK